ncbi:hypothetical protein MferCBS31731_001823 [Microsporum ferrugineum]
MTSPSAFGQTMRDLLLQGSYSDMEITCEDFTFKVHRAIVCTQSHFFKGALSGDFKEATARTIDLPDDDLETIERVLSFIYLQDYEETGHIVQLESTNTPEPPKANTRAATNSSYTKKVEGTTANAAASNNVQVYIAADKFGITPLKSLAAEKFTRWVNTNWDSPAFLHIVEEVMTSVPSHDQVLRNILADAISKNLTLFVNQKAILPLIESFGSLGSAIISKLVETGRVGAREQEKPRDLPRFGQVLRPRTCRNCTAVLSGGNIEYDNGAIRCAFCLVRN